MRPCVMIPIFLLQTWLLGLISIGFVAGAAYFGHEWTQRSWVWYPLTQRSVFSPTLGWDQPTLFLALAVVLLLVATLGGEIVRVVVMVTRKPSRTDRRGPNAAFKPLEVMQLLRPDGSELHIELHGPTDGIPVILTHGWGMHGAEWNYLVRDLASRFRLIVWDEPGLGKSTRPTNRDYSIEKLARDLEAVLKATTDRPAVLLGHSIGGMITLTFAKLFPAALGSRVIGLVLTHTTPTDPVETTSGAAIFKAIEKPVLMPLMHMTIFLSPLVWAMNWLSYRNGSAHLSTMRSSFGGTETWEEIEFATRFQVMASPAVIARGMLGMMRYDAMDVLPQIRVPALVVVGDLDSTTKPEAGQTICAMVPEARLLTLSPARHLGLIEHHEFYAAAVRKFVHETEATFSRPRVAASVVK